DQVEAANKAAAAQQPNPIVVKLKHFSLAGLALCVVFFLIVEALFQYLWPEEREKPESLAKWRGFFDGYYVLLGAAVMLFVVRDWVFANTTPPEEPFLDNPLRGLGFVGSRMTAFKIWFMLLWKLIWPV